MTQIWLIANILAKETKFRLMLHSDIRYRHGYHDILTHVDFRTEARGPFVYGNYGGWLQLVHIGNHRYTVVM